MRPLELMINDQVMRAHCQKINGVLWCHINGRTVVYESPNARQSRKNTQNASTTEIASPMPGKIIKVNVKPGQSVEAQHVLVVMEAMKMEYSLKAPIEHTIKKVLCQEGQTVQLGQILIEFEEKKS